MKPSHRIFCYASKRSKLLFETESKAMNFIRYNAENIKDESGYAPIRAYYCKSCGGWHVTSKEKITTKVLTDIKNEVMEDIAELTGTKTWKDYSHALCNLIHRIYGYLKYSENNGTPEDVQFAISLRDEYCPMLIKDITSNLNIIDVDNMERKSEAVEYYLGILDKFGCYSDVISEFRTGIESAKNKAVLKEQERIERIHQAEKDNEVTQKLMKLENMLHNVNTALKTDNQGKAKCIIHNAVSILTTLTGEQTARQDVMLYINRFMNIRKNIE